MDPGSSPTTCGTTRRRRLGDRCSIEICGRTPRRAALRCPEPYSSRSTSEPAADDSELSQGALPRPLQESLDLLFQLANREWLGEKVVRAQLHRRGDQVRARRYDDDGRTVAALANLPEHGLTVQLRHEHVENDDTHLLSPQNLERFVAVCGEEDFVLFPQQSMETL